MRNSVKVLLMASCILLGAGGVLAKDKGLGIGVSIGVKNGIKADVDASIGGRKGINANVDASIGGRKRGINANVDASIGGRKRGINANVDASIGGRKGLNADVDASIGGKKGVNVNVDIGLGTDTGSKPRPGSDVTDRDDRDKPDGALTSSQRQAFNDMSNSEKKALLKRCYSIGGGGYDPALVNLCKLLRMSASR